MASIDEYRHLIQTILTEYSEIKAANEEVSRWAELNVR